MASASTLCAPYPSPCDVSRNSRIITSPDASQSSKAERSLANILDQELIIAAANASFDAFYFETGRRRKIYSQPARKGRRNGAPAWIKLDHAANINIYLTQPDGKTELLEPSEGCPPCPKPLQRLAMYHPSLGFNSARLFPPPLDGFGRADTTVRCWSRSTMGYPYVDARQLRKFAKGPRTATAVSQSPLPPPLQRQPKAMVGTTPLMAHAVTRRERHHVRGFEGQSSRSKPVLVASPVVPSRLTLSPGFEPGQATLES